MVIGVKLTQWIKKAQAVVLVDQFRFKPRTSKETVFSQSKVVMAPKMAVEVVAEEDSQ